MEKQSRTSCRFESYSEQSGETFPLSKRKSCGGPRHIKLGKCRTDLKVLDVLRGFDALPAPKQELVRKGSDRKLRNNGKSLAGSAYYWTNAEGKAKGICGSSFSEVPLG